MDITLENSIEFVLYGISYGLLLGMTAWVIGSTLELFLKIVNK